MAFFVGRLFVVETMKTTQTPHDGPISEGIRDAIRASGKTPYVIAKEVTARADINGDIKLTGPQIYRFLNKEKGLSLAVLDEIALVLDLGIRKLPPEERRSKKSRHREIFQERLDRLDAIALDKTIGVDQRITALDEAYNTIYRENLWEGSEVPTLFSHLNSLKQDIRNEAAKNAPRLTRMQILNPGYVDLDDDDDDVVIDDEEEEEDYERREEARKAALMAEPTSLALQARLDSLKLPAGFDESGLNGKLQKLWDRYYALVTRPGLSPADVEKINQRHQLERQRIMDEPRPGEPDRPLSFREKLDSLRCQMVSMTLGMTGSSRSSTRFTMGS